jgi:glycerol-3-phosphate dehydrogenase
MVMSAADFFVRRIGALYFDLPRLSKMLDPCLALMANRLNWHETRADAERKELKRLIGLAAHF